MIATAVWMTLTTPAGHADLYVNDIPAARLDGQHALRMPLNEYVRAGENRVGLRPSRQRGQWVEAGPVHLLVEEHSFDGETPIGRRTLLDTTVEISPEQPGPAAFGRFVSGFGSAPSLEGYRRIDAGAEAAIRDVLRQLAERWRRRNWAEILAFLSPYIRDYTGAYAQEDPETYRRDFTAMATQLTERGRVEYDEHDLDLDICGDGRLADCLARSGGAAIKVRMPEGSWYDFSLAVGVTSAGVVAVR